MSGLAQALLGLGYRVSGSDVRETVITRSLSSKGGVIFSGHDSSNISGADVVVFSSAIRKDNPELKAAQQAGIPVIARAEMLAELMRFKRFGIAVAGSHGKTSTTSMVASVMQAAGLDPTVIIGGMVKALGTHSLWGKGDFVVAEADESDGSFLRLTPCISVVTNIDREHLDFYPDLNAVSDTFLDFLERLPFYGVAVLCADDPAVASLIPQLKKRIITYGTSPESDCCATDILIDGMGISYTAVWRGEPLGRIEIRVPGLHYMRNSLAAVCIGMELEASFEAIQHGLYSYQGVGRRFEVLGEEDGVTVVDDYAHHPTEIAATLKAARQCWPERRLVVVFQPHRYTRTMALLDDFTHAFDEADEIWITDIYAASEQPIVGISGERLTRVVQDRLGSLAQYIPTHNEAVEMLSHELKAGEVALTLGAGSISQAGPRLLEKLHLRAHKQKEDVQIAV